MIDTYIACFTIFIIGFTTGVIYAHLTWDEEAEIEKLNLEE